MFASMSILKPLLLTFIITESTKDEVIDVLSSPGEDRPGREGARVVIGKTRAGRYLRVIYIPDPQPDSIFVITAYEVRGKALFAYRRRLRRKGKR